MQNHKLLSFLLALLASVCLWVYAVTVVNPDDTKTITNVKVNFIGIPELENKKLMITDGKEQYITVEVSGRRSDLKELTSTSVEVVADVSYIDSTGDFEVSWSLDPPSTVASGDIGVVSSNASKVRISVSERLERPEIPVTVEYQGEMAEGYVRDAAVMNPGTISVTGPAEEVEKIACAVVVVDLENASQNISQDLAYRFEDANGQTLNVSANVSASVPTVRVSVPVLCYKEVPLRVNLVEGGGATEEDVTITIEPRIIGVTGSAEALENLNEIVIKELDLAQITEDQSWTITPELPSGVNIRASDPTVKLSIAFNGLITKKFTIPCNLIQLVNDGEHLDFGEQNVVIYIRGKLSAISALRTENIIITADMVNQYDPATKTVTLTISLPENLAVGVLGGPYTVQIIDTSAGG